MKVVKVQIELGIDDNDKFLLPGETIGDEFTPMYNLDAIANYLNDKLYNDPEWFGDFGPENIVEIKDYE